VAYAIINPNSTESMTASMLDAAIAVSPTAEFKGITSSDGPPSIQGEADGAAAVPPLLKLVEQTGDPSEGIIIGCFDDTGLASAARLTSKPVVGIGQAAFYAAALRQWRFSVVTTLDVSVPIIERNI